MIICDRCGAKGQKEEMPPEEESVRMAEATIRWNEGSEDLHFDLCEPCGKQAAAKLARFMLEKEAI